MTAWQSQSNGIAFSIGLARQLLSSHEPKPGSQAGIRRCNREIPEELLLPALKFYVGQMQYVGSSSYNGANATPASEPWPSSIRVWFHVCFWPARPICPKYQSVIGIRSPMKELADSQTHVGRHMNRQISLPTVGIVFFSATLIFGSADAALKSTTVERYDVAVAKAVSFLCLGQADATLRAG